ALAADLVGLTISPYPRPRTGYCPNSEHSVLIYLPQCPNSDGTNSTDAVCEFCTGGAYQMVDRAQELREQAAWCLEQAKATTDPIRHTELVNIAARLHELANGFGGEFGAVLRAFNDTNMTPPASEPVIQQQQIQSERKE